MCKLQLFVLLFLFQFSNLNAQLSFTSPEEVIQYLAGGWLYIGECDGSSELACTSAAASNPPALSFHTQIYFEETSSDIPEHIKYLRDEE